MAVKILWRSSAMVLPTLALLSLSLDAAPLVAGRRANMQSYLVYVGTYTEPQTHSEGIYVYRFRAGHLTPLGLAAKTTNPSFLAVDPSRGFLYAVNETEKYQGRKSGAVSAFRIDRSDGKLSFLNQVATGGTDPCFVSLDRTGKHVMVANYTSGSVAVFPVMEDGRLSERSAFVQHTGSGVNPERQAGPHTHMILASPDNRFVLVSDLGTDALSVYHFDASRGALTSNRPPFVSIHPGSGPRHFAFDPGGHFVYLLSEMKSTVTVLSYDPPRGVLHVLQTVSALPTSFKGESTAAEIALDRAGRFLYASNRGDDTITVFAVDSENHTLSPVEHVLSGGKFPRSFALDPTGRYLLAANEHSNNIVLFRRDSRTGKLTPAGPALDVPAPVCIVFLPVE
jgi:6-phosphogluconolactonase